VLWLTVVAGVLMAWWIDHARQMVANHYTEMLDWRFRAEALEDYLRNDLSEKVTYGNSGGYGSVVVEGSRGTRIYHDRIRSTASK